MNFVSFQGGETTGSIGAKTLNPVRKVPKKIQTPAADTVNFRGSDYDDSSAGSVLFKGTVSILAAVGLLGLAHKKNIFAKIKNANVKKYINNATQPCYNFCHKTKEIAISIYKKIKSVFLK